MTDEYRRSNRETAKQPKKVNAWCARCDAYYGPVFGKCPNCGRKNKSKFKKETNAR